MHIEHTEQVNRLPAEFDSNTLALVGYEQRFFGFRVGELGFLIPLDVYCEVLDKVQINPLPIVRPWFRGLLNLRGNLVPIFDLKIFLQESQTDNKKRRLFVIGRGDKAVALWIDNNPELLEFHNAKSLEKLPDLPLGLQHCVSGGYLLNGQLWLDVQLAELFNTLGAGNMIRRK